MLQIARSAGGLGQAQHSLLCLTSIQIVHSCQTSIMSHCLSCRHLPDHYFPVGQQASVTLFQALRLDAGSTRGIVLGLHSLDAARIR